VLEEAVNLYIEKINDIAKRHKVKLEYFTKWDSPVTHFNEEVIQAVEKASKKNNYKVHYLYSGPGHDAKYINKMTKSGMIFVKSIKGISHNEKEYTPDSD